MRSFALVSLGLVLLGVVGLDSALAQRPGMIRITAHEIGSRRVEDGPRGPGHVTVVWEALFNRGLTPKPIGHVESVCTLLARNSWNCSATYLLPRGKLVVSGATRLEGAYALPVIGGTGLYDGARGVLSGQTTAVFPRTERLVFRLLLQP
jgi:hypothetical protein